MPVRDVTRPSTALRVAAVVHLFYPDLWDELARYLRNLPASARLIVTMPRHDFQMQQRIEIDWPGATFFILPNRGRDIGPFLKIVEQGALAGSDVVCKLHGKRSAEAGPRAILGEIWRQACLQSLLGSPALVAKALRRFEVDPTLGMLGPRSLRMPNPDVTVETAWGDNRSATFDLVQRLGVSPSEFTLDFFAGTMFWVRRKVLDRLASLNITQDSFPEECGEIDGALHHALERVLGFLPTLAGLSIGDMDPGDVDL
jgi:lipopolysaccharide biosynthesis protein